MGVPYSDAWDMPVDMALDMLGLSTNTAKSKQSDSDKPQPKSLVQNTPPSVANAPRKQVAVRRKSQLNKNPTQ